MSYKNYKIAMKLAPKCRYYTTVGGRTGAEIKKTEELLGIKFSKQLTKFYKKYGYLSFFGNEIFGISPDDVDELEGNSVGYALNDRGEYNLPHEWIPVYNFDEGYMAYLDYSHLNKEKEPRVIVAHFNGEEYIMDEILAEDFGDFVLNLVTEQLEMQENI